MNINKSKAMNANELRISNLIFGLPLEFEDDKENWEVCEVVILDTVGHTDYEVWVESKSSSEHFAEFKPIPLTEEWLLKFGFVRSKQPNGAVFYSKDEFRILRQSENSKLFSLFDYFRMTVFINHVHSLQNLYQSLCQKELEIK